MSRPTCDIWPRSWPVASTSAGRRGGRQARISTRSTHAPLRRRKSLLKPDLAHPGTYNANPLSAAAAPTTAVAARPGPRRGQSHGTPSCVPPIARCWSRRACRGDIYASPRPSVIYPSDRRDGRSRDVRPVGSRPPSCAGARSGRLPRQDRRMGPGRDEPRRRRRSGAAGGWRWDVKRTDMAALFRRSRRRSTPQRQASRRALKAGARGHHPRHLEQPFILAPQPRRGCYGWTSVLPGADLPGRSGRWG